MGPIDYSIDVATPFQSALQGYQAGAAIRDDQLKQQQMQQAQAAQQQMQQDLRAFSQIQNPGAADYARITTRYPQLSEQFKRSWEMLKPEQQSNELGHATQVYAATLNGRPEVAEQLLRERATALRNSGDEAKAKHAETMAQLVKLDPAGASRTVGLMLSSVMDPDKFAETFGKLGTEGRAAEQAPAELKKKQADAETAAVKAKYANSEALLDLEKKGWDIKAVVADMAFKKESNRIAAINAAAARETNALKREELQIKLQEARTALDDKIRGKVAETESGAATIDNTLNTIERLKRNPSLNDVLGSIEGRVPALVSDEANDAIALIETLGSQAFLSQLPAMKGAGALSDAEGKKLQAALTSLDRKQSEQQFRANLDDVSRLMTKARENLSRKSGVPLAKPDTPAAPGSRPPLSSFQTNTGGAGGAF